MERSTPRLSQRSTNEQVTTPQTPQQINLAFSPQQFRKALEVQQMDMQLLDSQFTKVPLQQHENSLTPCKGVYLLHSSRESSAKKQTGTLTTSASMMIKPSQAKENDSNFVAEAEQTIGVFNRTQSISTKAYKMLIGNTLPNGQEIQLHRNQYSNSKLYPIYQMDEEEIQSVMTADCDDDQSEMLMDPLDEEILEEDDMATDTSSERKESGFSKLKQKLKDKWKSVTSKWKLALANEKLIRQNNSPLKQNKTKRTLQQNIRVNQSPQSPLVKQLVQTGKLNLSPSAAAATSCSPHSTSSPLSKKVVENLMTKKNVSPKLLAVKKLISESFRETPKKSMVETPKKQVLTTPVKQTAPADSFICKNITSTPSTATPQKTNSLSNFMNLLTPRTKSILALRKVNAASFRSPGESTPSTPRTPALRLTVEEEALLAQHDLDFFDTLKRKECYPFFYRFCDKERSTENVDFWHQVQHYRQLPSASQRLQKALELFHTFVDQNAPRALNIDGKSIDQLRQKIIQCEDESLMTVDMFDDLQRTIEVVMVDSFARFKISDTYKQMVLEYVARLNQPPSTPRNIGTPLIKTPHLKRQETNNSLLHSAKK